MELAGTQFELSHLFGQICFLIRYLSGCFHCIAAHRSSGAYVQLQVDFMGKRTTKIWFPWGDTEFVGSWAWRASGIAQGFPEMLEIQGRSTCNLKDNLFAELAWILSTPKQFGSQFLAPNRPIHTFFMSAEAEKISRESVESKVCHNRRHVSHQCRIWKSLDGKTANTHTGKSRFWEKR